MGSEDLSAYSPGIFLAGPAKASRNILKENVSSPSRAVLWLLGLGVWPQSGKGSSRCCCCSFRRAQTPPALPCPPRRPGFHTDFLTKQSPPHPHSLLSPHGEKFPRNRGACGLKPGADAFPVISSFNKHLLCSHCVSVSVSGAGDTAGIHGTLPVLVWRTVWVKL